MKLLMERIVGNVVVTVMVFLAIIAFTAVLFVPILFIEQFGALVGGLFTFTWLVIIFTAWDYVFDKWG